MKESPEPAVFDFDDLSKLDKPNVDFVVFKRLDDATFWLGQSYSSNVARLNFIGCVEALVSVCRYYWMRDSEFMNKLNGLIGEANDFLAKNFPEHSEISSDQTISKTDVGFRLAKNKFDLVMTIITKSTKGLPHIDEVG